MEWKDVIAQPEFQDANSTVQALVRESWVRERYVPQLKEAGVSPEGIAALAQEAVTNYDNGEGYVKSALGSFTRAVGSVVPGIVQGTGEVLGSDTLVETGKEWQQGLEDFATINPSMTKTNFVSGAVGSAIGFLGPMGAGMGAAKALGIATKLGGTVGALSAAGASGAAEAGEEADQLGLTGEERYAKVLSGIPAEIAPELVPFHLGTEFRALSRVLGLRDMAEKAAYTGGIKRAVIENAAEEGTTRLMNNAASIALSPDNAPGLFTGVGSDSLAGGIGGFTFGLLGAGGGSDPSTPAAPTDPNTPTNPAAAAAPNTPGSPFSGRVAIEAPKVPELFDDTVGAPVPAGEIPAGATFAGSAAEMTRLTNNMSIGLATLQGDEDASAILQDVGDMVEANSETTIFSPTRKEAPEVEDTMPTKEELDDLTKQAEKAAPEVKLEGDALEKQLDYEDELINKTGRITAGEAVKITRVLLDMIGLSDATVTVNATGTFVDEGSMYSHNGQVDEFGNVVLNEKGVAAATPVHEVLGHMALPQLEMLAPELFKEGVEMMNGVASELRDAIKSRYSRAGIEFTEAELIDEFMATVYGNESAEFWQKYVSNPKVIQKIQQWIAKVKLFFAKMLASKGVKPGMTMAEWAKQANRRVLAGAFKARAVPMGNYGTTAMTDGAKLTGPGKFSIRGYHGTPHKIESGFSLDKIGTGEGAQVYGHGLYFAEEKAVARGYQDTLSKKWDKVSIKGEQLKEQMSDAAIAIRGFLNYRAGAPKMSFIEWKRETVARMRGAAVNGPGQGNPQRAAELRAAADVIESLKRNDINNKGNLYTVELLPDEDEFLDWDAPLSEQSEKVKAALESIGLGEDFAAGYDTEPTGERIYNLLALGQKGIRVDLATIAKGSPKQASEYLASIGIPGIRYLDGQSRDGGEGTRNYVLFDDKLIKILEENGRSVSPRNSRAGDKPTPKIDLTAARARIQKASGPVSANLPAPDPGVTTPVPTNMRGLLGDRAKKPEVKNSLAGFQKFIQEYVDGKHGTRELIEAQKDFEEAFSAKVVFRGEGRNMGFTGIPGVEWWSESPKVASIYGDVQLATVDSKAKILRLEAPPHTNEDTSKGHAELKKILKRNGIDVKVNDGYVDEAFFMENPEVVSVLRKEGYQIVHTTMDDGVGSFVLDSSILKRHPEKGVKNSLAGERDAKYLELAKDPEANKEELQHMVDEVRLLQRKIVHIRDTEVIRNPTWDDRRALSSEEKNEYPDDKSGDPLTRFTKDKYGNTWVWRSSKGIHAQIEPAISRLESVDVGQNEFDPRVADPVTYDDSGKVIPLSKRFDATKKDIRNSLADPRMKDTGVGQGPRGGKTGEEVLKEGYQYLSGNQQEAMDKALPMFQAVEDEGGSYADHSSQITQLTNPILGGGVDNMRLGAYIGIYLRKLNDVIRNSPDDSDRAWAMHDKKKLYQDHVDVGAALGQLVKSLDMALMLGNDPVFLTNYQELLANFGGKDKEAKKFKNEVNIYHEETSKLINDQLGTVDKEVVGAGAEQGLAAVIKGDATGDEAAAELDAAVTDTVGPLEESAKDEEEDWYQKGFELLDEKRKAAVERLTDHISMIARWKDYLANTQSSLASDSANRTAAKFAEMVKQPGFSRAKAQAALAAEEAGLDAELKNLRDLGKAKTKVAKPAKGAKAKAVPETDMATLAANRMVTAINAILTPEGRKDKKVDQREAILKAITQAVMLESGFRFDVMGYEGDMALTIGLLANNKEVLASSIARAYEILQNDPITRGFTTEKRLAAFMQLATNTDVATKAAFGEKQMAKVLRDEMKALDRTITQVVKNAALSANTAADLEKQLRDPKRQLEIKLGVGTLNDVVTAVINEYNKTAKARMEALVESGKKKDAKSSARSEFIKKRREERAQRRRDKQPPAPLDENEKKALLNRPPEKALEYLARQFGFDLKAIKKIISPEGQKTALEAKTQALGQALGLDDEQITKFMAPVIKAAMANISKAQEKQLTKDINKRIEQNQGPAQAPKGKKRDVLSDNEKIIEIIKRGGLSRDNIEQMLLKNADAQKFTPEFRKEMEDLAERMNNMTLSPSARDEAKMDFLGSIRAQTGVGFFGLWGEYTMSNIFMSIFSTLKVNAYAGGMGAAINSYITLTHVMPRLIAAAAKEHNQPVPNMLLVRKLLTRSLRIGVGSGMQNPARHMLYNGKSLDATDTTLHFDSSAQEQLAHYPDTPVVWPNGKAVPKWLDKTTKGVSRLSKYTRRTMAATDLYMRNGPQEMLNTAAVIQALVGSGKLPTTYEQAKIAVEIAQYGEPLKDALAKARKQAAADVAAGTTKKENQDARVVEILDSKLLNTITVEKKEAMAAVAQRSTYANQTEGFPGIISGAIIDLVKKMPGLGFLLPAVRMPMEFFAQSLEWTPLGWANAMAVRRSRYDKSNPFSRSKTASIAYLLGIDTTGRKWKHLEAGTTEGRELDLWFKGHYGTALMGIAALLAFLNKDDDDDEGFFITAEGPTDPQERALFYERGGRPYTLGWGKARLNYMEMPAVSALTAVGSYVDVVKYGKPDEEEAAKFVFAGLRTLESFAKQGVLRNFTDVLGGRGSGYSEQTGAASTIKPFVRALSNTIAPRLGSEFNQIISGKLDNKSYMGQLFANVPFVPQLSNLPALDFFGEEIHQKLGGPMGEIFPMANHRIGRTMSTDEQLNFVAKMKANKLTTSRRFIEDHSEVSKDYDFMRQWQKDAGKATREWLTPEVMTRFNEMYNEDPKDAQNEFDKQLRKIRDNALRQTGKVIFTR